MKTLGIIAGGGALPHAVAQCAQDAGKKVFVVALSSAADETIGSFPHAWTSIGEAGKLLRLLHEHDCEDVLFAGRVARPKFVELKTDAKGVMLMPRIAAAARRGDDALLRTLTEILADEGFRTVGIAEAAPGLLTTEGVLGRIVPDQDNERDVTRAIGVVRTLGALDVGQAAIVCAGLVLAVEAAEGTDAMIVRAGALPHNVRGTSENRRGVLAKALKPTQNGKTDLPVIGLQTVQNCSDAGLAGIAVEAGYSLILDRAAVIQAADAAGLFVLGFESRV